MFVKDPCLFRGMKIRVILGDDFVERKLMPAEIATIGEEVPVADIHQIKEIAGRFHQGTIRLVHSPVGKGSFPDCADGFFQILKRRFHVPLIPPVPFATAPNI